VIVDEDHVQFATKSVKLERGIRELFETVDHFGPYGVAVDVLDTREIILIGVDDTGSVTIPPQMSGSPDIFVVSDSDPGIEVLHGAVKVSLGCACNDVVVVGHEDDVMD